MFNFFKDKHSYLNKRDIHSLYKIVNLLQNELIEIDSFDERLIDFKFNTYDNSFRVMYFHMEELLREENSVKLKIFYKINNESKEDRLITDLTVLDNGKIPTNNKYIIGVLDLLPHILEYYTNKFDSNSKIVNSNPLYLYIVNVVEIYINIYLLKKEQ